eukprot:TRINITY_DN6348_c0_g1_i1.p1 TRINITY_DN6348_c0_g1~~TRINITY_DN6348_c0_g1_i1.p1  ORF type:complete len:213 (+),score=56.04 TRINITY_DN6348_c0_g1_i1:44-682(+)
MGQFLSSLCDCCRSREDEGSHGGGVSERTRLLSSGRSNSEGLYSEGAPEDLLESFDEPTRGERHSRARGGRGRNSSEFPHNQVNAEQSALSKILHDAAHELIDVSGAPIAASNLEYHEFAERAQEYSRKLQLAAPNIALKYNGESSPPGQWTDGLTLISSTTEQENIIMDEEGISYEDIDLLNTLGDKVTESMHNMQRLTNGLVVPFGNAEE